MPSIVVGSTVTARVTITNNSGQAVSITLRTGLVPVGANGPLTTATVEQELSVGQSATFVIPVTMPNAPATQDFLVDVYARFLWDTQAVLVSSHKASEPVAVVAPAYNFGVSIGW